MSDTKPPDGPSPQALEAFARAIERGLRRAHPEYDFIVTTKHNADAGRQKESK